MSHMVYLACTLWCSILFGARVTEGAPEVEPSLAKRLTARRGPGIAPKRPRAEHRLPAAPGAIVDVDVRHLHGHVRPPGVALGLVAVESRDLQQQPIGLLGRLGEGVLVRHLAVLVHHRTAFLDHTGAFPVGRHRASIPQRDG